MRETLFVGDIVYDEYVQEPFVACSASVEAIFTYANTPTGTTRIFMICVTIVRGRSFYMTRPVSNCASVDH